MRREFLMKRFIIDGEIHFCYSAAVARSDSRIARRAVVQCWFTAVPGRIHDPVMIRRDRLIRRLDEQKALFQNPSYVRTVQRWVEQDGQKRQVEKQQKVRPWWRTDAAGHVLLSVHFGTKPIEFEKGKAGIAVPSKEKLPALIDSLVAAVKAGELDEVLKKATKPGEAKAR